MSEQSEAISQAFLRECEYHWGELFQNTYSGAIYAEWLNRLFRQLHPNATTTERREILTGAFSQSWAESNPTLGPAEYRQLLPTFQRLAAQIVRQ